MQRIILVGGGHSHLLVLEALQKSDNLPVEVLLISENRWQYYSGMLPGLIAGHYREEECRVDLQRLCGNVGVGFQQGRVVKLDCNSREVILETGDVHKFDILSLAVGSEVALEGLRGLGDRVLAVKPFATFLRGWNVLEEEMSAQQCSHVAIAGGGAAGVELALAVRYASPKSVEVSLYAAEGILPGHAPAVRRRIKTQLRRSRITVVRSRLRVAEGVAHLNRRPLTADRVIAATGAEPPQWLRDSGLDLDDAGFVRVDACHRSVNAPCVFATGDVCARADVVLPRSGVAAVRVGTVLAHNLLVSPEQRPWREYRPRRTMLYLISCGRRYAVLSFGGLSLAGTWVWWLKNYIDRKFMDRFQTLANCPDFENSTTEKIDENTKL